MNSPQELSVTNNLMETNNTLASSFRGRNTAMSTDDLRKARESRAGFL